MSAPLCLFATITPKPEHFAAARDAVVGILAATRAEPGCRIFRLHADEAAARLFLYEEWTDQAALEAHYAEPYTRAVFAAYEDWLAQPPEIMRMSPALG